MKKYNKYCVKQKMKKTQINKKKSEKNYIKSNSFLFDIIIIIFLILKKKKKNHKIYIEFNHLTCLHYTFYYYYY